MPRKWELRLVLGGAKIVHAGGSHIWETIRMYCTGVCTPYLAPLHDKHAVDKALRTRSQPIKPQRALTAQVRTYIYVATTYRVVV